MSNKGCCYNCESRYLNCHSECIDYIKECEERQERNELIKKNRSKSADMMFYCIQKEIKHDKRRRKLKNR